MVPRMIQCLSFRRGFFLFLSLSLSRWFAEERREIGGWSGSSQGHKREFSYIGGTDGVPWAQ